MSKIFLSILLLTWTFLAGAEVISVTKVWDQAPHSAFTDLIRFNEKFYMTFREGIAHAGDNGAVRLIESKKGENWESVHIFKLDGYDLRDPKLSIMPDNRLMITMAGVNSDSRKIFVTTSMDGIQWTSLQEIMNNEWLWRITWYKGKAYGVSYKEIDGPERIATLYESDDGLNYNKLIEWEIPGFPSEATLRISESGEMIALIRRGTFAWIGVSQAPYIDWIWKETQEFVGGPNFICLPDSTMWASGRFISKWEAKTVLASMTKNSLTQELVLPSGGDTSYPGMVYYDGILWLSYYSSHEGKTAIYLARISFL